jgi:hypothetical protein
MMKQPIVVLGEDSALVRDFVIAARSREQDVLRVTSSDLIHHLSTYSHIPTRGPSRVRWTLGSSTIENMASISVLNCLHDIPLACFDEVDPADRTYVYEEFVAYLGFALDQCSNVINEPNGAALTGWTDSLPVQWATVSILAPSMKTPRHEICIPIKFDPQCIYTCDFYDWFNWLPSVRTAPDILTLCYEKPVGIPAAVWFVDDWALCFDALTGRKFDIVSEVGQQMVSLTLCLAARFRLRLGQALFFVGRDRITFGSIAPWVSYESAPLRVRPELVGQLSLVLG